MDRIGKLKLAFVAAALTAAITTGTLYAAGEPASLDGDTVDYDMKSGVITATGNVLMSFLQDINAEASAKGILPDPLRGSIGVIEGNQLYDIIRQLTPINGTALLSAYARGNTDALGPLRVYLKVETR